MLARKVAFSGAETVEIMVKQENMKRLFFTLFAISALLFTACEDNGGNNTPNDNPIEKPEDKPTDDPNDKPNDEPVEKPDEPTGLLAIAFTTEEVAVSYPNDMLSEAQLLLDIVATPASAAEELVQYYRTMLSFEATTESGVAVELDATNCVASAAEGTLTATLSAEALLPYIYGGERSFYLTATAVDDGNSFSTEKLSVMAQQLNIVLTAPEQIALGEAITFEVKIGNETMNDSVAIYEATTRTRVTNPFTPEYDGDYSFYAQYYTTASEAVAVKVVDNSSVDLSELDPQPSSVDFKNRVLIIEHTGTGCVNCPYMANALKELSESNYSEKYNLAAAHYSGLANGDPAKSSAATLIGFVRGVSGFPAATFNYHYPKIAGASLANLKTHIAYTWKATAQASAGVVVKDKDDELSVDVVVKSGETQPYRIACWLLEDNIYGAQSGAMEQWHNYHDHALREITGVIEETMDIAGDELGEIASGESVEYSVSIPVDATWNNEELSVLVVLSAPNADYGNEYEVVNTILCHNNSSKSIEYNK